MNHTSIDNCSHYILFLETIKSLSLQKWTKIKKPVSQSDQWPEGRYAHAASRINGPVFVMSGGYGDGGSALSDLWLCVTNQWIKV